MYSTMLRNLLFMISMQEIQFKVLLMELTEL